MLLINSCSLILPGFFISYVKKIVICRFLDKMNLNCTKLTYKVHDSTWSWEAERQVRDWITEIMEGGYRKQFMTVRNTDMKWRLKWGQVHLRSGGGGHLSAWVAQIDSHHFNFHNPVVEYIHFDPSLLIYLKNCMPMLCTDNEYRNNYAQTHSIFMSIIMVLISLSTNSGMFLSGWMD